MEEQKNKLLVMSDIVVLFRMIKEITVKF